MQHKLVSSNESSFFVLVFVVIIYLLLSTLIKQVQFTKITHDGLGRLRILLASITGVILLACVNILVFNIINMFHYTVADSVLEELPYMTTFVLFLVALFIWLEYRLNWRK